LYLPLFYPFYFPLFYINRTALMPSLSPQVRSMSENAI
jgi:hypothetical protein